MKLQLDTTNKTIQIEQDVNLQEMFDLLERLLPDGLWKEFTLITHQNTMIINSPIVTPIIIDRYPTYPTYPWITYDTNSANKSNNIKMDAKLVSDNAVYSIETK